jgi:hypothetical protein
MPKPTLKLTAREQRLLDRQLRAAAKVPLKTQLAFMEAWRGQKHLCMEDLAKSLGITEDAAWGIFSKPPSYRQRVALEVKGIPKTTKQAFLDAVKGGKTVGEAQALAGISSDASLCLLRRAMKRNTYITMDWVAK